MKYKLFVDICPPDKGFGFILISEKIKLCTTSYSTNLAYTPTVKVILLNYEVSQTEANFLEKQ